MMPAFRTPISPSRAGGSPRNSMRSPSRCSAPPGPANCARRSRGSTRSPISASWRDWPLGKTRHPGESRGPFVHGSEAVGRVPAFAGTADLGLQSGRPSRRQDRRASARVATASSGRGAGRGEDIHRRHTRRSASPAPGAVAARGARHGAAIGGAAEATVWGSGERLPLAQAAMVNAYQVHCQEFDCVHEGAVVHPMAAVLPASSAGPSARAGFPARG